MSSMRSIQVIGAVLLVGALPGRAMAQARTVTGTIRVRVIGQETGVCTNASGEYRLSAPAGTARVAAWYHGTLGALRSLGPTDSIADFDLEQRREPPRPDEPLIYIDGVRVGGELEIEGPREILVLNGIELTPVPDRCRVTPPGRRGGDS
jgi:hypothetical protein